MNEEIGISVVLQAELDRFNKNMMDAGRIVETTGGTMDKATKRASDGFAKLEAALDPASKALQRLERDVTKVQIAADKGAVSDERAAKVVAQLNTQYEMTIARLNGVSVAQTGLAAQTTRGMGSARSMGNAVQQAGYQVGDFAVQVASGQGVMRPFIQQGTQLVSMFGPWGAVVGAAGAVVGALYTSLSSTGAAADETKSSFDLLMEATAQMNEETQKSVNLGREETEVLLAKAKALDTVTRAEVTSKESQLASLETQLAQHQRELEAAKYIPDSDASGVATNRALGDVSADQKQIDTLKEALNDLNGQLDVSAGEVADFQAHLKNLHLGYEDQIAANGQLAAALQVSQHEYDVTKQKIAFMAGEGGFKGSETAARAAAEEYVASADALKKVQEAQSGATKTSETYAKSTANLNDQFKDYITSETVKNESLERQLQGQKELNPLIEAEAQWREKFNRDLTPDEIALLEQVYEVRAKTSGLIKEQTDLEKEAQKQAAETARIWQHAGENIQDALADTLMNGGSFFDKLADIAKRAAAEAAAAWVFSGNFSASSFSNSLGSMFSGGAGGSTGSFGGGFSSLFSGIGSMFGIGSGASAAGPYAASTVAAGAASGTASSGALGSLTGGGGAASAAYAIPVWGWIAAAAALVKGQVEGSPRDSVKGGISTLLMPSMEEWQADPMRSLQNTLNPIGTVAMDFGAPEWLGGMFNQFDPAGGILKELGAPSWMAPLGGAFGTREPSNMVAGSMVDFTKGVASAPSYDSDEASQANISAVQALSEQLLAIEKQLVSITGGTLTGFAALNVGSRDGINAGFGATDASSRASIKNFANSEEGAQAALEYMVAELAKNITGVQNEAFKKALASGTGSDILANVQFVANYLTLVDDGSTALVDALKTINDAFDDAVTKATALGLATDMLNTKRDEETSAVRKQYQTALDGLKAQGQGLIEQFVSTNLTPLTTFKNSINLGSLTTLSPEQQFEMAQQQFRSLDDHASAGDVAAYGQSYLQQAQMFYASGEQYQNAFREVNSELNERITYFQEAQIEAQNALGITVQTSFQDQTEALLEGLEGVKSQIKALQRAIELAA